MSVPAFCTTFESFDTTVLTTRGPAAVSVAKDGNIRRRGNGELLKLLQNTSSMPIFTEKESQAWRRMPIMPALERLPALPTWSSEVVPHVCQECVDRQTDIQFVLAYFSVCAEPPGLMP